MPCCMYQSILYFRKLFQILFQNIKLIISNYNKFFLLEICETYEKS